jgi:hypothetical protein
MTDKVRECGVKDCHIAISTHNRSGRCGGYVYLKRGTVMKDGTIPKPHTKLSVQMAEAKKENAAKGRTGKSTHKKTLPAPTVLATAAVVVLADELVALKVPAEALDRFWQRLSLEDKARIIERELHGATL